MAARPLMAVISCLDTATHTMHTAAPARALVLPLSRTDPEIALAMRGRASPMTVTARVAAMSMAVSAQFLPDFMKSRRSVMPSFF